MGHSSIKMTERYAHLSPDVRKDAVRLLDRPAVELHVNADRWVVQLAKTTSETGWRRRESNAVTFARLQALHLSLRRVPYGQTGR